MDFESLKIRLTEALEPVIKDNFMELVDLDVAQGGPLIRISIDKAGGKITLDECADMSRKFAEILDLSGIAGGDYALEVGSPGINRALKKKEDFIRFAGSKIKLVTKEKVGNSRVFIGILKGMADDKVTVGLGDTEISIDWSNIRKTNLEVDIF
jgi:ribosome maturation factor RimP